MKKKFKESKGEFLKIKIYLAYKETGKNVFFLTLANINQV